VSVSFNAANQARCVVKMKLSQFGFYKSSHVELDGEEYIVVVDVVKVDDKVRREVPPVINGVSIKTVNGK
jgi:hypothetical protein